MSSIDSAASPPRLLSRLSDASRSILLLGLLLYFFGFLTVSSYLARFGIATFDILNARFAVAGVLVLVPLMFVFWTAWHFGKQFPKSGYFKAQGRGIRFTFLFFLPIIASYAGSVFSLLFRLGTYSAPVSADSLMYHALAPWDYVGHHIIPAIPAILPGGAFVTGYTVTIAAYILLPLYFIVLTAEWALRRARIRPRAVLEAAPARAAVADGTPAAADRPDEPQQRRWLHHGLRLLEVCLIVYLAIDAIYAYEAVANRLADFSTIRSMDLDSSTMGYWLLLSIGGFYLFLMSHDVTSKGLLRAAIDSFGSPQVTANLFSVVVVPLLSSILLFGSAIFPRISYTIGGGQPREVGLPGANALGTTSQDQVFLIGESSQAYFLVVLRGSSGRAVQVSKSELPMIITRATPSLAGGGGQPLPSASPSTNASPERTPDSLGGHAGPSESVGVQRQTRR